jgi:1-acyl-sn-glycerol-3-phosphate acyltransferase
VLYAVLKPFAVAVMRLLFRLESRGREHVPARGPVLLVANHSSLLDPPLVGGATDRHLHFLAKAELFRIPLFGRLIRGLNAHPLRREGGDAGALRTALRILRAGDALLMFPEGTRGDEGALRPPKAGAGMIALMSGAPVVPVYVSGSGRAWPRGRRLPRRGAVTVVFGPPVQIATDGARAGRKARAEAISRELMAAIARLSAQATAAAPQQDSRRARAMGGEGVMAQGPTQNLQGRSR